MARRPIVDALEIAVKDLDASIEQRAYREEPLFLSVHKVFGRPAREKSEELIGDRIPPIAYLIGELGFPFFCFFDHSCTPYRIILARKRELWRQPRSAGSLAAANKPCRYHSFTTSSPPFGPAGGGTDTVGDSATRTPARPAKNLP